MQHLDLGWWDGPDNRYWRSDADSAGLTHQQELPLLASDSSNNGFMLIDHPCERISRALVEPMSHVRWRASVGERRCLLVSANQDYVHFARVRVYDDDGLSDFWQRAVAMLEAATGGKPVPDVPDEWLMPCDCLQGWTEPTLWGLAFEGSPTCPAARDLVDHWDGREDFAYGDQIMLEVDAQEVIVQQMQVGVRQILHGLRADIADVMLERPTMRMDIPYRMLHSAIQHGGNAIAYALQALRTEPLGLLDLMAMNTQSADGFALRVVLLSGQSLPCILQAGGIAKALHRRTLRQAQRLGFHASHQCGQANGAFSEIPMDGKRWLSLMRQLTQLPTHLWPDRDDQWATCITIFQELESRLVMQSDSLGIAQWCLSCGYSDASKALNALTCKAAALQVAVKSFTDFSINFSQALDMALALATQTSPNINWESHGVRRYRFSAVTKALDVSRVGVTLKQLTSLCQTSIAQMTQAIFSCHPGLPHKFVCHRACTVTPLNSLDEVIGHGFESEICLQDVETVVDYLSNGVALWSVHLTGGHCLGTIALCLKRCAGMPFVHVRQVTGALNSKPCALLTRVAQDLTSGFDLDSLQSWGQYTQECEALRRGAGIG